MKKILTVLFLLNLALLKAQAPADVDLNFGPHPGFNEKVNAITIQPDGKILVGGSFTTYRGLTQNYLIRLNTDGSKDQTFDIGNGFNNIVNTIQLQPDGKIIIGGNFTSYNGESQMHLIRLNDDGSKDNSLAIGTGLNGNIYVLKLLADGKILAGGYFGTYQGLTAENLVRINSDGSADSTFNFGTFNDVVNNIHVLPDGKLLIPSTTHLGVAKKGLIRINTDGTEDTSFIISTGFDGIVSTTKLQLDGKILACGLFTSYQGIVQNRIVRLNSDGSLDSSFSIGSGFNKEVTTIELQPDGKILACGSFTSYQGQPENDVIRLNTDGSKDLTFDVGELFGNVYQIVLQPNGKILVGGDFISLENDAQCMLSSLENNGNQDLNFSVGSSNAYGFNSAARRILKLPNGKILVAGTFNSHQNSPIKNLILVNQDGTFDDSSFNIGSGFNGEIRSIALQTDGKIILGGYFTTFQGQEQNYLIRLNNDGSKDTSFNIGSGFNNPVQSIYIQPDGKILVGGVFSTYNGLTQNSLIRLNTDGSKDSTFNIGTGFYGWVYALNLQPDGKILVGGFILNFQDQPQQGMVRLNSNGSKDNSFAIGSSTTFNSGTLISDLKILPDGKILVAGIMKYQNQTLALLRLNSNGSYDSTFTIGSGFGNASVLTTFIQTDGKILAGGSFTTFQQQPQNRLIRLNSDGSKDMSFDIGDGFNNSVSAIQLQDDGKVWIAGAFDIYNNTSSASLIRLYGNNLAVPEFDNPKISLYPNPVADVINVYTTNNIVALQVYDVQGRLISQNKDSNSINVFNLNPGVFILKVCVNGNWVSKKFIKE